MIHNTIIDNAIITLYSCEMSKVDSEDMDVLVKEINKEIQKITSDISTSSIIDRLNKIRYYRSVLENLKKLPFIKQRTQEWLDLRKDRLTASDLADAVKGGLTSTSLAKKKANVIQDKTNYNYIPALKWGTMFEAMATRCYSQANNDIDIQDFGLICDKYNAHFGASPDGINGLGIMIEIKCPYSREIVDGYIPPKYKMQIQGQLAVCELCECDYIECNFKAFDSIEDYLQTIESSSRTNHGIIAEYLKDTGEFFYLYSDAYLTPQEAYANIQKQISDEKMLTVNNIIPWKLDHMNVQRVYFNEPEWQETIPKIVEFWKQVEAFKACPQSCLPVKSAAKKIMFVDDNDDDNDN